MDAFEPSPGPLGIIEIMGEDAAQFLRGQLTNDIYRLGTDNHALAAWCDAQGRTLAVLRVVPVDHGFWLVTDAALIDGLISRLRMYVLRARVTVADMRSTLAVVAAFVSDGPADGEARVVGNVTELGLSASDNAMQRVLRVRRRGQKTQDFEMATADPRWQLDRVDAGIPTLSAETRAAFVPQMLNLHWLHAVDFAKGCYPGQEVVARLHYRGRLKRRLFRLAWTGPDRADVGDAIVDANGTSQGTVIRAAQTDTGGRMLAVVKTAAIDHALNCAGQPLEVMSLPYPTPDNAT